MKTQEIVISEDGEKLVNPEDGFILIGAIFVAQTQDGKPTGGLVGRGYDDCTQYGQMTKFAYSKNQFLKALGITEMDASRYITYIKNTR